jgi:midasin (ATPase involved in ribosome maturation)
MQDPRTALIGTREADSGSTYFKPSKFVETIQREDGPVILLDELTRGTHEAWNILMTVLDEKQRYLRLDEATGSDDETRQNKVKVHPSVSFVATANIGSIYTATRVIDRAVKDRFTFIETDLLEPEEELDLLKQKVQGVEEDALFAIAKIAHNTREMCKSDSEPLTSLISTRQTIEMAKLIRDGFTLHETAELIVYPMYPDDLEEDSERSIIQKIFERYEDVKAGEELEDLFTDDEIRNASR